VSKQTIEDALITKTPRRWTFVQRKGLVSPTVSIIAF